MTDTEDIRCPTCGRDDFQSPRGMKMHHSRTHGESIAGVTVNCHHCGTETRTKQSKFEKLDRHFCDQDCEAAWRSTHLEGQNSHLWKGGKEVVECHQCGDRVERKPSRLASAKRTFCSNDCRGTWRSENWTGTNHPQWKGGSVTVTCAYCSSEVKRRRDQAEKYERNFCDTTCLGNWRSENQRGQDNPVWTGGESVRVAVRNVIGDEPWDDIAERVRAEACYYCGTTETTDGRALAVHHIVPIMAGGCNAEPLLMTLCPSCHRKVEAYTREITSPLLVG